MRAGYYCYGASQLLKFLDENTKNYSYEKLDHITKGYIKVSFDGFGRSYTNEACIFHLGREYGEWMLNNAEENEPT